MQTSLSRVSVAEDFDRLFQDEAMTMPANRSAVIVHELQENYNRTEFGWTYQQSHISANETFNNTGDEKQTVGTYHLDKE